MKIEKVNDNQIRCTLTKADLIDREIKLSELAYGTEKAKNLFRDMMQQASYEFGFEADDIPLMIEAIPLEGDRIVLVITKVDDPEELDTRFSKFSPSVHKESSLLEYEELEDHSQFPQGADDILDLFQKLQDKRSTGNTKNKRLTKPSSENDNTNDFSMVKLYSFATLNQVIQVSHVLNSCYNGLNSLYKSPGTNHYKLIISKGNHTNAEFNKFCNILSEYGVSERFNEASFAHIEEHHKLLRKNDALQALVQL